MLLILGALVFIVLIRYLWWLFSQETIHWVDEHLSFHGRIERDDWMGQATLLAKGEDTEFSKRYK